MLCDRIRYRCGCEGSKMRSFANIKNLQVVLVVSDTAKQVHRPSHNHVFVGKPRCLVVEGLEEEHPRIVIRIFVQELCRRLEARSQS